MYNRFFSLVSLNPRSSILLAVIGSLILLRSASAATSHESDSKGPAKKIALLIGINKYLSPKINKLDGCVNDVEDLRQLLTTKFDFREYDVKILRNEQASRSAIINAFQKLVESA